MRDEILQQATFRLKVHKPGGIFHIDVTTFQRTETVRCRPGVFAGLLRANQERLLTHFALAAAAAGTQNVARARGFAKTVRFIGAVSNFGRFPLGNGESCQFSQAGGECVAAERTFHFLSLFRTCFARVLALVAMGRKGLRTCLQRCFYSSLVQASRLARAICWRFGPPPASCARGQALPPFIPPALCKGCGNCRSLCRCASSPLCCAQLRAFLQSLAKQQRTSGPRHFFNASR